MEMIRLDRLMSERGYCTRGEIGSFLRSGRIKVSGKIASTGRIKVNPWDVTCDDVPLDPGRLYIIMNKPEGFTCSHKDKGDLVYDLLPSRWLKRNPPISCAGRLDKDTDGALFFTDDGELLHRLISPRCHVLKVYEAYLDAPFSQEGEKALREGGLVLEGEDKPLLPAGIERKEDNHFIVTLTEGRYHQVKRMFAAFGCQVERLSRLTFAGIGTQDLTPGAYRHLDEAEKALLFSALGGGCNSAKTLGGQ
ncbi:MAG: rRNA pseudouridine synthase [bacterium]|nr:rRNA pseudouridine synthase [bacterium]